MANKANFNKPKAAKLSDLKRTVQIPVIDESVGGDTPPKYCRKCGLQLDKLEQDRKPSYDTVTGRLGKEERYKMVCPMAHGKWNIFWGQDTGHTKAEVHIWYFFNSVSKVNTKMYSVS